MKIEYNGDGVIMLYDVDSETVKEYLVEVKEAIRRGYEKEIKDIEERKRI